MTGSELPARLTGLAIERVEDIVARSEDASAILEDEEFGFAWYEAPVPLELFRGPLDASAVRGQSAAAFTARLSEVRDWVLACGGIEAALRGSPLLAFVEDDGTLTSLDGFHRRYLAATEFGAVTVRTLFARRPVED